MLDAVLCLLRSGRGGSTADYGVGGAISGQVRAEIYCWRFVCGLLGRILLAGAAKRCMSILLYGGRCWPNLGEALLSLAVTVCAGSSDVFADVSVRSPLHEKVAVTAKRTWTHPLF